MDNRKIITIAKNGDLEITGEIKVGNEIIEIFTVFDKNFNLRTAFPFLR